MTDWTQTDKVAKKMTDSTEAIRALERVYERLTAWRDNANWMLIRCPGAYEQKWQNERDNYKACAEDVARALAHLRS